MRWISLCLLLTNCSSRETLTIFSAASLGAPLQKLATKFEKTHPNVRVQIELSGSRVACIKHTQQHLDTDLIFSADITFQLVLATIGNELEIES